MQPSPRFFQLFLPFYCSFCIKSFRKLLKQLKISIQFGLYVQFSYKTLQNYRQKMNKKRKQQIYQNIQNQRNQVTSQKQVIKIASRNLSDAYQSNNVQKKIQNLFFYCLELLPQNQVEDAIKKQMNQVEIKQSIFLQINTNQRFKDQVKIRLIILSEQKKNQNCINADIQKVCSVIKQYRQAVLLYIQSILKMCQIFSQLQQKTYQKILIRCNGLFMQLQQAPLKPQLFKNLIQLEKGFDPLFLNIKCKCNQRNINLQNSFCFDIRTSDRLIYAHNQILKCIQKLEVKQVLSSNLSTIQNKRCMNVSTIESMKTSEIQTSKVPVNRVKFKIKLRQNRLVEQKQERAQGTKQKQAPNRRKKSFRQRFSLSFDPKLRKTDPCDKTPISTQKLRRQPTSLLKSSQKGLFLSKRLNFKAINLQPLQNKSVKSSNASYQIQQCKFQKKQISLNQLKRKNHRRLKYLQSRTDRSSDNQKRQRNFSDYNYNDTRTAQDSCFPQRKISQILSRRKYARFQTQDQWSQKVQNQSPRVSQPIHFDIGSILRANLQIQCQQKSMRKRRISQVDEDAFKSPERNVTPQDGQLLKQILKLNMSQELNQSTNCQENEVVNVFQKRISSFSKQNKLQPQAINQQFPQQSIQPTSGNNEQTDQMVDAERLHTDTKLIIQNKQQVAHKTKKIILKASKVNCSELRTYFQKLKIIDQSSLIYEISNHQHYICEFYTNESIFNVIVFSPSCDFKSVEIKIFHQVEQNQFVKQKDLLDKFRNLILNNFVQIIAKSTFNFQRIAIKKSNENLEWVSDCGFQQKDDKYVRQLTLIQNKQNKQFLNISCSILKIRQFQNEGFLYSDQISTFKIGKYDIDNCVFNQQQIDQFQSKSFQNLQSISSVNSLLQLNDLDTYDTNQEIQTMLLQQSQQKSSNIDLKILSIQKMLGNKFLINNGWIKTESQLIFNQKHLKICYVQLPDKYQMYLGNGFQHIVTMKNKITHYKTRLETCKNQQNNNKRQNDNSKTSTKIRMFSKQLYGLIKHQDGMAYYGNWQMNFHFKHQFIGKVIYPFQTTSGQNHLIFGNQTFFVTIYKNNQFLMGWEVEQNDFLY